MRRNLIPVLLGGKFSPRSISGLAFAIRPDLNVSTDVNGITAIGPAWGTTIGVSQTSTAEPDLKTGWGPNGQNIIQCGAGEYFNMGSSVVVTDCTIVAVMSCDTTGIRTIIGSSPATGNIRVNNGANTLGVTVSGGGVVNAGWAANARANVNLSVVALAYSAGGTGTLTTYVDGIANTPVSSIGTAGFSFNRLFATGAGTNPLTGFAGPFLIYNRVLTASEIAQLTAFLTPWRGLGLYVSTTGSDSSITPWLSATPWLTLGQALGFQYRGDETVYFDSTATFRYTTGISTTAAGKSSSRITFDGGAWPSTSSKAQFRGSTAPTLTLESGTIYSFSDAGAGTATFVNYVPGGTITFASNYGLGSMQRLVQTGGVALTPGVGEWGLVAGKRYVNAGTALVNGDIENVIEGLGAPITPSQNNWVMRNIRVAFSAGRGWTNAGANNWTLDGCEALFCQSDGIDTDNAPTGLVYQNCVAAYSGIGDVGSGGAAGDGYSLHDTTQATLTGCQAWWNGKSGFDHTGGTTLTHDRCLAVGTMPYRMTGAGSSGTMTVKNSIGVVPASAAALWPHGITNSSTTGTVVSDNNTFYALTASGNGLYQAGSGGSLTGKNNIVVGFNVGLSFTGAGTLTADHNDYYTNNSNYSGASAGAGDITSNPLLTNPASYDFSIPAGSPCKRAGVTISGVTTDYIGAARGSPPSIGAYE